MIAVSCERSCLLERGGQGASGEGLYPTTSLQAPSRGLRRHLACLRQRHAPFRNKRLFPQVLLSLHAKLLEAGVGHFPPSFRAEARAWQMLPLAHGRLSVNRVFVVGVYPREESSKLDNTIISYENFWLK